MASNLKLQGRQGHDNRALSFPLPHLKQSIANSLSEVIANMVVPECKNKCKELLRIDIDREVQPRILQILDEIEKPQKSNKNKRRMSRTAAL